MSRWINALVQAVLVALFTYAAVVGATFNGLLQPNLRLISMLFLTALIVGWLMLRWQQGWLWHHTPLDWAIASWLVAIGISLMVNSDSWRRSVLSLWYVLFYVGLWYGLYDLMANGILRRDKLAEALILGGLPVVVLGYLQFLSWLRVWLAPLVSGSPNVELLRPGSIFGNPNMLGGFLIVFIPLAAGLMVARRGAARVIFGFLLIIGAVLLALTYSRAAWGGLVIGAILWVGLMLAAQGLLNPDRFVRWWARQSRLVQSELRTTALLSVLLLFLIGGVTFYSLGNSGQNISLRGGIYGPAITLFSERPIVGYGLFTFGQGLARLRSMPPFEPQSHPHSVPLQVAAELGVIGLVALAVSVYASVRMMMHNWQDAPPRERRILIGSIAAVVAFVAHQLIDIPAMVPAIAITGLMALLVAVFRPSLPLPLAGWQGRAGTSIVALLWVGLLVFGWWSAVHYAAYTTILSETIDQQTYLDGAQRLQSIIDADPELAVYHQQQGYLYGLAAADGEAEALAKAITAYEQFTLLEPQSAIGWANLAALYQQAGESERSLEALRQAATFAPDAPHFSFMLGARLEAAGDESSARRAYRQAVRAEPNVVLLAAWQETPLRQEVSAQVRLSEFARTVRAWKQGNFEEARALWNRSVYKTLNTSEVHVMNALLALAEGNREAAQDALESAALVIVTEDDAGWVAFGRARLALYDGDAAAAQDALEVVYMHITPGPFERDFEDGVNIAYGQFFRLANERQFLPQVGYPSADTLLLALLELQAP